MKVHLDIKDGRCFTHVGSLSGGTWSYVDFGIVQIPIALGSRPEVRLVAVQTILPRFQTGFGMTCGHDKDNPPIFICAKCGRPMEYLATLPEIANLPAVYAYRCFPCRRVDTVALD